MTKQSLLPGSSDKISTTLQAIKQTRVRHNPESSKWKHYVNSLFQEIGFSTQEINPRLSSISLPDDDQSPKAVVAFIQPGESFENLIPGLSWETFMVLATSYYRVDWGVLTDGLQLKLIQYKGQKIKQRLYWQDLDQIIGQQSLEDFAAIFMVFNIIKNSKPQANIQTEKPIGNSESGTSLARAGTLVIVQEFLKELLERAKNKTPLHAKVSLGAHNYVSSSAGKKGLKYGYIVVMDRGIVNLYIDNGVADWNKVEFIRLFEHKTEIEEAFGESLEWHLKPEQKSSYVRFTISGYDLRNREVWEELQNKLIEAMIRMEKAFRPYIKQLALPKK